MTPATPGIEANDRCDEHILAVMVSNTDFRYRMVLAPEVYSVAAPESAYLVHTLSANTKLLDVTATSLDHDVW